MIRNDVLIDKFIKWVIFNPFLASMVIYGVLTTIITHYIINLPTNGVVNNDEIVAIWFLVALGVVVFHVLLFLISTFNNDFLKQFYDVYIYYNSKDLTYLQYNYLKKLENEKNK